MQSRDGSGEHMETSQRQPRHRTLVRPAWKPCQLEDICVARYQRLTLTGLLHDVAFLARGVASDDLPTASIIVLGFCVILNFILNSGTGPRLFLGSHFEILSKGFRLHTLTH